MRLLSSQEDKERGLPENTGWPILGLEPSERGKLRQKAWSRRICDCYIGYALGWSGYKVPNLPGKERLMS